MVYSVKITAGESFSFQQVFLSEKEMDQCRDNIVTKDKDLHRTQYYFPKLQEAKKVQNMVLKPFALIIAFFRDILTFPFNYQKLKSTLRETLAVYQYLKNQDIDPKSLNKDAFEIVFTWLKIENNHLLDFKGISKMEDKSIIDVNDGLKFIGPKKIVRNEINEKKVDFPNLSNIESALGSLFGAVSGADFLGVRDLT